MIKVFTKTGESEDTLTSLGNWADTTGNTKYKDDIPFNIDWDNPILSVNRWNDTEKVSQQIVLGAETINVSKVHILAHTSNSAFTDEGTLIGKLIFHYPDATFTEQNLVIGENIAEWAFERDNVPFLIKHKQPLNFGYTFRTNQDSDNVYNGRAFYIKTPLDSSKLLERIELTLENNVYLDIKVNSISIDTDYDYEEVIETGIFPKVDVLPTADASQRGKILRVEGGAGVQDEIYICKKVADDSYTWDLL